MASHLGMSVQRVKVETTAQEFRKWMIYLAQQRVQDYEDSFAMTTKADYRAALIASEIRRSYVKDSQKVRLKDFVLQFETPSVKAKKQAEASKIPIKQRIQQQKKRWLSALGLPSGDR